MAAQGEFVLQNKQLLNTQYNATLINPLAIPDSVKESPQWDTANRWTYEYAMWYLNNYTTMPTELNATNLLDLNISLALNPLLISFVLDCRLFFVVTGTSSSNGSNPFRPIVTILLRRPLRNATFNSSVPASVIISVLSNRLLLFILEPVHLSPCRLCL